jgi:hypothetical protein
MYMQGFPEKLLISEGQLSELESKSGEKLFNFKPEDKLISFRRDVGNMLSPWSNVRYNRGRVSMVPFIAAGQNAFDLMKRMEVDNSNVNRVAQKVALATTERCVKISPLTLHHRMGCTHVKSLRRVINRTRGTQLNDKLSKLRSPHPQAALSGMARRSNIPKADSTTESTQRNNKDIRYEVAHMDVHGPYVKSVLGEYTWYVSLTAKPSGFTYVQFSKTPNCIKEALELSFVEMGRPLTIRTDTNTHIVNSNPNNPTQFQIWLIKQEIGLKLSAPGAQYENGCAEKAGGQDIYGHATALITHAGISEKWWPFGVLNYVRIKNSIPQRSDSPTPLELHYGVIPWIGHFRVPFCPAFAKVEKSKRGPSPNFRSRVTECMYLGPAVRHKAGTDLLFSFRTKRLIVTRDAIFDEDFNFVRRINGGWKFQCGLLVDQNGNKITLDNDVDENSEYGSQFDNLQSYNDADIPLSQQATFLEDALFTPPEGESFVVETQHDSQTGNSETSPDASDDSEDGDSSSSDDDDSLADNNLPTPPKYRRNPPRNRKSPTRLTFNMGKDAEHPQEYAGAMIPMSADADLLLQALLTDANTDTYVGHQELSSSTFWTRRFNDISVAMSTSTTPYEHFAGAMSATSTDADLLLHALLTSDHIDTHVGPQDVASSTFWTDGFNDLTVAMSTYIVPSVVASSTPSKTMETLPLTGQIVPQWNLCDRRFKEFARLYGLTEAQRAYTKELQGIIDAGVFSELVRLPPGHLALPLMCLPSFKVQPEGCVKYRIVAGGNLQREGQSFLLEDLPAPVMDRVSFRILLCVAASHHCFVHTVDITQAFLNALMPDEVYVRPTKEMGIQHGWVWRLLKAIYGCKQAPALWFETFSTFLRSQGLTPTAADPCMFIKRIDSGFLLCGLHSDDLIMAATSMDIMTPFKSAIMSEYKLRDQGDIHGREYLGLMVHYNRIEGWAHLSCDRAIAAMLKQHGLSEIRPRTTPALKKSINNDTPASEHATLHNLDMASFIGGCNYFASACRPDIATKVSILSSIDKANPTVSDVEDSLWLAGYLNNINSRPNFGLHFSASGEQSMSSLMENLTPQSYADADWAGSPSTAKSRSGAYITMLGGPIYWKSQFQKVIALSSTHSEIIALSDLCKRLVWILSLLNELGFQFPLAPVWEDNQASLITIKKPTTSERSRHIEVRYLWTRQLHEMKTCIFKWIESKNNLADHFTKIEVANVQRSFIEKMCSSLQT